MLANWKIRLSRADRRAALDHDVRTDRRAGADPHVRTDDAVGADADAGRELRAGGDHGGRVDRGPVPGRRLCAAVAVSPAGRSTVVKSASATIAPLHTRDPAHAPARRAALDRAHLELELVARHHRAAEARAIERATASVDPAASPSADAMHEQRRGLRQRLADEDARHDRAARKVAGEERLVDGDALPRDQAHAVLEADDAVDEEQRVAVREQARASQRRAIDARPSSDADVRLSALFRASKLRMTSSVMSIDLEP